MNIDTTFDAQKLAWLVGVHLVFVISAFMLALSDAGAAATMAANRGGNFRPRRLLLATRLAHAAKLLRHRSSTNSEPSATPK